MGVRQILQKEVEESELCLSREKEESTYRRDLRKRIELLNWVLDKMKNPDIFICKIIESKINGIIDEINKSDSIFEADPLDSELRILDWILYQVCSNKLKSLKGYNIK
jgi:hypothetical protein